MIVLFTDFGLAGPYTGQVKAALHLTAPGVPVVDLFADAPACDPRASAYLLAAFAPWFPAGTVFLCVVDPGVGGPRLPLVLEADGRRYVGPDNGLFELVVRRAATVRTWTIEWRPERLSSSFHARDLFAPIAGGLAAESLPDQALGPAAATRKPEWPDDLAEIVYVDHYGNAMTGLRASSLAPDARLGVCGLEISRARTFGDVHPRAAFWYESSNGLVEIAVNRGRADAILGLAIGTLVVARV